MVEKHALRFIINKLTQLCYGLYLDPYSKYSHWQTTSIIRRRRSKNTRLRISIFMLLLPKSKSILLFRTSFDHKSILFILYGILKYYIKKKKKNLILKHQINSQELLNVDNHKLIIHANIYMYIMKLHIF